MVAKLFSKKTPKGRVLKSGLKNLLRTATGGKLAWRQVYRAAEALEELSKSQIEFIHHSCPGKMLIEPEPAQSGDCHSSSAARGEARQRTACQTIARKQE